MNTMCGGTGPRPMLEWRDSRFNFYRAKAGPLDMLVGWGSMSRADGSEWWFQVGEAKSKRRDYKTREDAMVAAEAAAEEYAAAILKAIGR